MIGRADRMTPPVRIPSRREYVAGGDGSLAGHRMVAESDVELAERIKARAHELGFDLVGVVPAGPMTTVDRYRAWIGEGYHGQMAYLARPQAVTVRE